MQYISTYGAATTTDDALDDIDLSGSVALVTGATSGLGAEAARSLAAVGATVILAVRDIAAASVLSDRIRDRHPHAALEAVQLDLADLGSVRAAANLLAARRQPLNILINNAAVMYTPFARTADGFEQQFGVNHLGHFALTTRLRTSLSAGAQQAGKPSRVVTVASDAHHGYPVDLDDPNFSRRRYDKFAAYGQSKSANVLMTVELASRLTGDIHAFAVHPGVCATNLARHMSRADFTEMRRLSSDDPDLLRNLKSVPAAAATTVWAATEPQLSEHNGAYLADCALAQASSHATEHRTAGALWDLSEQLTAQQSPTQSTGVPIR